MIIADWFNKYFTGIVQEVADKTLTSHIPNKTFLRLAVISHSQLRTVWFEAWSDHSHFRSTVVDF